MKNVKIIVRIFFAVITVVFIFSAIISAESVERFEFDGIGDAVSLKDAIDNVDVSISSDIHPVIESLGDKVNVDYSTVDYSIINAIKYCEKNEVSNDITDGLKNLLIYGTDEEKLQFLKFKSYTLPTRLDKQNKSGVAIYRGGTPICIEWEMKEVCISREVCEQVADTTALICVLWNFNKTACLAWDYALRTVCRWKQECTQIPACVEYYHDVY